jgi:hypothetical protein
MPLPTEKRFLNKYLKAIFQDERLAREYFKRFARKYDQQTLSESLCDIVESLGFYGGYKVRRKLIEAIPIKQDECVLDIGPQMGMECFLLAEVYNRVLVAEPDALTAGLLKNIAEYYQTEDGKKASDVLDIRRAGIIPVGSTDLAVLSKEGPIGPGLEYDARGAASIEDTFGRNFADRIFCHQICLLMPAKPRLLVLLKTLSSFCNKGGVITCGDYLCEVERVVQEYCNFANLELRREKEKYHYRAAVLKHPTSEIKRHIEALLPDFNVTFRYLTRTGHLFTIAKYRSSVK